MPSSSELNRALWVEDLLEIRPLEGATTTYRTPEETAWARRWPMEEIWKARKQ